MRFLPRRSSSETPRALAPPATRPNVPEPAADALSAFLASRIEDPVQHLSLQLECRVPLAAHRTTVAHWASELRLDLQTAIDAGEGMQPPAESITVAWARITTVDTDDDPGSLLALRDLLSPYAALFDTDGAITYPMELDIGGVVLVEQLTVDAPWRHRGLGPLYLLSLLEELGRGRGIAAASITDACRTAHHSDRRALHQMLTRAGFGVVAGGLYATDLTAERHTAIRRRMLEQHRPPRRSMNRRRSSNRYRRG